MILAAVGLPVLSLGCGADETVDSVSHKKSQAPAIASSDKSRRTDAPGASRVAKSDRPDPVEKTTPVQFQPGTVKQPPVIAAVDPQPKPEPVFRPSDDRPKHDDMQLAKLGIHRYESKRLRLYTDLDPKVATRLPKLIDGAFDAWGAYFGKLPPTKEKAPFQVTGYLMVDKARFDRAGLVPADLPTFKNGRHRGYEFWMHNPPWPYYRRHLLIHEATHCFMYAVRDKRFPTWYMEGMAEYFGTHEIEKDGRVQYGVMPQRFNDFVGFGRIEFVQQGSRDGKPLSLKHVVELKATDFVYNQAYSWSWAFCKFLDSHPRYQKPFRELGRIESSREFTRQFRQFVADNSPHIFSEWTLFATGLVYGYDPLRSAVEIKPGKPLPTDKPVLTTLKTDRGWQSSGVWLEKGNEIVIAATGRFHLADKPKPWISEPQGISFTYFLGRPLGEVVAVIVPDSKRDLPITVRTLDMIPVGRNGRVRATINGTVYLRVNDSFAKLADNSGTVKITIRRPDTQP